MTKKKNSPSQNTQTQHEATLPINFSSLKIKLFIDSNFVKDNIFNIRPCSSAKDLRFLPNT